MYILGLRKFPWINMGIMFLNERWCRSERTKDARTFLLNEQFFRAEFWNNEHVFTERTTFVNNRTWENEQNWWKMNGDFNYEQNQFFVEWFKKRTKYVVHERWTNEMKKWAEHQARIGCMRAEVCGPVPQNLNRAMP